MLRSAEKESGLESHTFSSGHWNAISFPGSVTSSEAESSVLLAGAAHAQFAGILGELRSLGVALG